MIHTKILVVDEQWSVVGSTNFDNRSFGLNDEVNMAVRDEAVADRLRSDFLADKEASKEISFSEWQRRSAMERLNEALGWMLQRQQ
jgi:cardiolipin synthase